MKIRLLENIRTPRVSGERGEVIGVETSLAQQLEQHGQAAFLPGETEEAEAEEAELPSKKAKGKR